MSASESSPKKRGAKRAGDAQPVAAATPLATIMGAARQATAHAGGAGPYQAATANSFFSQLGNAYGIDPETVARNPAVVRTIADRTHLHNIVREEEATRTRAQHARDSAVQDGLCDGKQQYVKLASVLLNAAGKVNRSPRDPSTSTAMPPAKRPKKRETDESYRPQESAIEGGSVDGSMPPPASKSSKGGKSAKAGKTSKSVKQQQAPRTNANPPTSHAEILRDERVLIDERAPRPAETPTLVIESDALATNSVALASRRGAYNPRAVAALGGEMHHVPDVAIDVVAIQRHPMVATPSRSVAAPSNSSIRSIEEYREPLVGKDPLAALTGTVGFTSDIARNPAADPRNEYAVEGGLLPALHAEVMRLVTRKDYLHNAESTLASTKRTQSADVPSCVTHLLKEMASVRNMPDHLLTMALDAVSSADFGDVVGTAERYARLDPAAQSDVRELRASMDPIVVERTGVEALSIQFEKYYLRDSVLETNMLEKTTRERLAAKLPRGTSIVRPPTYVHGLDVKELATHATSTAAAARASWEDADRRHATALARSCVASSLLEEDMARTIHGKASFSGQHSAKHAAGVTANAPSYDIVHLTYSEFVRCLSNQYEPAIVDLLPLCSNGERCECSRAEARAEGRVTPDPAPLANAMNGHAPVVSRALPPEVHDPDGNHPQYQQTNLSTFSPSPSGSSGGGGSNSRHERRFIGRTFYSPAVLAEVARLYSDKDGADNTAALQRLAPGECLRCHWKQIHTAYHSIGMDQLSVRTGEEGHVPPLNRFSVSVNCENGFRADMCLPRLRNGLPSNICGDVPIYNEMLISYKRMAVPDPLNPTRAKKVHYVQLNGMDFRPSSQK